MSPNYNRKDDDCALVGLNTSVKGKLNTGQSFESLAKNWTIKAITIDGLAEHISKGYAWMPGLLKPGARRKNENVDRAELLAVDVDHGMTIDESLLMPIIKEWGCLGITSSSHSEVEHKFRVVFRLPVAIVGAENIKSANKLLIEAIGVADKACKDAARFFFGAENAQVFLKQDVRLPADWQEQCKVLIDSTKEAVEPLLRPVAVMPQLGSTNLIELLHHDIYPRLSPEQIYRWSGHEWASKTVDKMRGACPWHESQSGAAFYVDRKNGTWLWRCPSCDIGGSPVEYRYRMSGGKGSPQGKDFVVVVKELAADAGITIPEVRTVKTLQERINQINTGVDPTQGATPAQTPVAERLQESGVLSVATQREKDQFSLLQEMQSTTFDPAMLLPHTLAVDVRRDADLFAIDPVAIWVYLLPAVSSLMGKISIDFGGFKVPNIIWSLIAQKSGRGKTRAMNLVNAPLWILEQQAEETFQEAMKVYKSAAKTAAKDGDDEPVKPIREKFLFNIATPQAVVKRLGEQEHGVFWSRDEFKGLLKGLDQFTGEGEGLEILLETWDGKAAQVDRVSTEDSFFVSESRLSMGGGTQPKTARKMFDPEDPQGVMARMLIATAQDIEYKRIKGSPVLPSKLADLYDWVRAEPWGDLAPTVEADDLFTSIAEYFNNAPCPNDGLDAWMKKAAGQCLRVAGVLHVLECYYDQNKNRSLITRSTLMRAYYYVSLCRNWLYVLQGEMSDSAAVPTLLQKILDKTKNLGGSATLPDLYRNINALRKLAKDEGKTISEATHSLCSELETLGKGVLFSDEKGKIIFSTQKSATLNTPNLESYTPPTIEECVDTNTYQHQPTRQHAGEDSKTKPSQETPSTDSTEPLKVGDDVEVTGGSHKGAVEKIVEISTTPNGDIQYRVFYESVQCPETNFDTWFSANELKPYDWASRKRF